MATIIEDYVSLEVAKLLKAKGFDEPVATCYSNYNGLKPYKLINTGVYSYKNSTEHSPFWISAPTLQMAMKWLREVYNLFIQLRTIPHTTATMEQKYYFFTVHKNRRILEFRKDSPSDHYATYEQACDAAIKYCLENLI